MIGQTSKVSFLSFLLYCFGFGFWIAPDCVLETYKDYLERGRTAADDMFFSDETELQQEVTDEHISHQQDTSDDHIPFEDDGMDSDYREPRAYRATPRAKRSRRRSKAQETEPPKKKQKTVRTDRAVAGSSKDGR